MAVNDMKRTIPAALLVLAVVGLSACGRTVEGTPMPVSSETGSSSYRERIVDRSGAFDEDAKKLQEEQDDIRLLDPCGMLDEAAVDALGPRHYFGPDREPDECVVQFDREAPQHTLHTINVSLSAAGDTSRDDTIGGRPAVVRPSGTSCWIYVEYAKERVFSYRGLASQGTDPCPVLRPVVAASMPRLDDPILRDDSTKQPATGHAKIDPCQALDSAYPNDQEFYMTGLASKSPYRCDFWLDGPPERDDKNRRSVDFIYSPEALVNFTSQGDRKLQIAGVPANEHSTPESGYCVITAYVGADNPIPAKDYSGETDNKVEALKVTGHHDTDCTQTRKLAVAAVKLYN